MDDDQFKELRDKLDYIQGYSFQNGVLNGLYFIFISLGLMWIKWT